MFRRRATAEQPEKRESAAHEPQEAADSKGPDPGGKGRPTPKRREAERRRRVYIQAPKDRKEAARMARERQKQADTGGKQSVRDVRREQSRALRTGDESKLGPRDAGPVRRLVRDVVDSRRGVGGYFLFVTLGVLLVQILLSVATSQGIVTVQASAQIQMFLMYGWYALILLVAFDSFVMVREMKRVVRERHPDHSARGLGMYAVMRSLQIRRLRLPPPKIKPGEGIRD